VENIKQFCWKYSSFIQQWKNFENRLRFEKVTVLPKVWWLPFFWDRCIYEYRYMNVVSPQYTEHVFCIPWFYSAMQQLTSLNITHRRWQIMVDKINASLYGKFKNCVLCVLEAVMLSPRPKWPRGQNFGLGLEVLASFNITASKLEVWSAGWKCFMLFIVLKHYQVRRQVRRI